MLPDVVEGAANEGNGANKRGCTDENLEGKRLEEEPLRQTDCEYAGDADKPQQAAERASLPCLGLRARGWAGLRCRDYAERADHEGDERVCAGFPRVVEQDYAARYGPDVGPYNAGLPGEPFGKSLRAVCDRPRRSRLEP